MEKVEIDHPFHEHPLILREIVDDEESVDCYGCRDPICKRDCAYVCVQEKHCSSSISSSISGILFHKRCGELATQISHPSHPHHPLYLVDFNVQISRECDLCQRTLDFELGYQCSRCDFNLDLACKKLNKNELIGEPRQLNHPCHIHPLMLFRIPPFLFNCHGCGTEDRDMVYACSTCELFIHKACALLPPLLSTNHHHHQLSLSSRFPFHHRYGFNYRCSVCNRYFNWAYWLYYCNDCRFFVHLKCATSEKKPNLEQEKNADGSILIEYPLEECDVSKELITPFVIQENGLDKIPNAKDMPQLITMQRMKIYTLFLNHMHSLSLVSEWSDQDEDDDDHDDIDEVKMKICDVCVTSISSPPYYECAPCNYFVHSVCFLLPKTLSSVKSQLYGDCAETHEDYHNFALINSCFFQCDICKYCTNGSVYACVECEMSIDVKCACLPTAIKHAAHPHHKLIKTKVAHEERRKYKCPGCGSSSYENFGYLCTCDDCDFAMCAECILLPKSVMNRKWDKHQLPLTYDASIDHPTDFYCAFCEEQMHPKEWMYHCRPCDNSFHIDCLKTESGVFKNHKLGHQLELNRFHPHTLTFTCITMSKWCSVCHADVYSTLGFECSSCYKYVVCWDCGSEELY